MIKSIYINLPVTDLKKTRAFWTGLGFSFNEDFSNDDAICLVMNEGLIYVMLLRKDFFQTFTSKQIGDNNITRGLIAIEVDSKDKVNSMVNKAFDLGAKRYREATDHGWMFYDSFEDLDGHQWEVLFTDSSQIPTN
jgi:uncharacterized protein